MIENYIAEHALGSLWALVWHFGAIGVVIIGALAWAWFMPIFRKTALWVALGATVMFFTAATYTKLGADHVQAKWDSAVLAAIKQGEAARRDAERDIAPATPGELCNDPRNRDKC